MENGERAGAMRRSIGIPGVKRQLRATVDAETHARIEAASARYGVARGTIAADAIRAGLKATLERLRRAARAETRERGESEHAPAAGAAGETAK